MKSGPFGSKVHLVLKGPLLTPTFILVYVLFFHYIDRKKEMIVITIPKTEVKRFLAILKLNAEMIQCGNLRFTKDGLYMDGMDSSNICFFRTFLPFDCDEEVSVGVAYKVLSKIIGSFSLIESITLKIQGDMDEIALSIETASGVSTFGVKTMYIDSDTIDVPEMEYDITLNLPFKLIHQAFGQAETMEATAVSLKWINNKLKLWYETDEVKATINLGTSETIADPFSVSIASIYTKKLCSAKLDDNLSIGLSPNCPVLFKASYPERGYTELYVAPRIDDEMN